MLIEFRVMIEVLKVRTAGWDYCLFYSGASESGFVAIVLAFAAAYWFAIDDPENAVSTYRKTAGTVGAVQPGVPLVEANPQSGRASTGSLRAPA
ncbi:MAG: hypothetical protein IVW56_01985 [Candidatus Binataceae bacterium]|nr:hypothetical protein [Candidatus Binataceae bacterium]